MITQILNNRWANLGLRLVVGAVFVYAGVIKMIAPQPFADSIASFQLLPVQLIALLALWLPAFEVTVGSLLLLGFYKRTAALAVMMMTGAFALALVSALIRGLQVDCGCFGIGKASVYRDWLSLGRTLLLMAGAFIIYPREGMEGFQRAKFGSYWSTDRIKFLLMFIFLLSRQ